MEKNDGKVDERLELVPAVTSAGWVGLYYLAPSRSGSERPTAYRTGSGLWLRSAGSRLVPVSHERAGESSAWQQSRDSAGP